MTARRSETNIGPTFLGIGVQKAGTTWLDNILRLHPEIWMPPLKELHFFDDLTYGEKSGDTRRYFSGNSYIRNRWRRYLRSELKRSLRFPKRSSLFWTSRFLFGKRNFAWYAGLFPANVQSRGEVSPEYCFSDSKMIGRIRRAFPDLRTILILRNPVERAWSHAKMELIWRRKLKPSEVTVSDFLSFLSLENVAVKSNYSTILNNWFTGFPEEQILVCFFDDIQERPSEMLADIFRFLDVDSNWRPDPELLGKKTMEGVHYPIPNSVEIFLKKKYAEEVQAVARIFPGRELLSRWGYLSD